MTEPKLSEALLLELMDEVRERGKTAPVTSDLFSHESALTFQRARQLALDPKAWTVEERGPHRRLFSVCSTGWKSSSARRR